MPFLINCTSINIYWIDAPRKCIRKFYFQYLNEKFIQSETKRKKLEQACGITDIDLRMRRVLDADSGERIEMTRRVPPEDPAATNRLIRWIYDGWRGEIGS